MLRWEFRAQQTAAIEKFLPVPGKVMAVASVCRWAEPQGSLGAVSRMAPSSAAPIEHFWELLRPRRARCVKSRTGSSSAACSECRGET